MRKDWYSGFTLIELLVVISVISLLSSVVLSSLSGVRARARDAKRIQHITELIPLFDEYFHRKNEPLGYGDDRGVHISKKCSSTDIYSDLQNFSLISYVPADPQDTACGDDSDDAYFYGWDSNHPAGQYDFCISINTLETQQALERLSQKFGIPIDNQGKVRHVTGGCDANICDADFNYCFQRSWGDY